MNWVHTTAIILHVLLAAGIVGLVLLQRGKGADAGAGFGAGASGTVFGARGSASFLSRTTAVLAALFFITSLTLAYLGGRPTSGGSVIDRLPLPATGSSVPAVPVAPAATNDSDAVPAAPPAADDAKPEQPSNKAP